MKKALSLIFAVVMIISIIPLSGFAPEIASVFASVANAEALSGSCGTNVKYKLDTDTGLLTISGSGAMAAGDSSSGLFPKNYSIQKVVIEKGVTSIGDNAFYSCSNLTSITIPDTVTEIGEYAFCYCSSLESITLPNSVKTAGMNTFYACTALKNITLSSNLDSISNYMFGYCTALTSFSVPSSVKTIEGYAFWNCTGLRSLKIADSVTRIDDGAFRKCTGLLEVTLSKNVKKITQDCFADCTSLTSVKIPNGVEAIGRTAFGSCLRLAAVYIPASVTEISNEAFKNTAVCDVYYSGGQIEWENVSKNGAFETEYIVHYTSDQSDVKLAAPVVNATNVASSGKNKLTWNEISGAAKYGVYRSTSADGKYTLMKTTTSTSYINTSATAGKKYYYKVCAITSDGIEGLYCAPISRVCDCARPVLTTANDAATGRIVIKWDAVKGASSYKVYRATTKDGVYEPVKTTRDTSYTYTTGTAGTKYYFKVMAISLNNEANSAYSSYKYRTCDLAAPVISISLSSSGKPTITWAAVKGAVSYKVYRATSKDGKYKLMKTVTNPKYTNTAFDAATTYYYKVKAVHGNTDANSAYSSIVNIKTK